MLISLLVLIVSLAVLVWSSDVFVDGASATSRHLGISPMIVGMIVVGFGTSAPELLVSALAAAQGNPSLALGNALGSNISNIGLIIGLTALISPIMVKSGLLKKEMPILLAITVGFAILISDSQITRLDGVALLVVFVLISFWLVRQSLKSGADVLSGEAQNMLAAHALPTKTVARLKLLAGLVLLVISSHFFVESAVELAKTLGVSDLVIGLTVVAIGTSLPELASSLAAIRRNEHDMALGNVIGSNLFNTLVAVGVAGVIQPFSANGGEVLRDLGAVLFLTVILFLFCFDYKKHKGHINRYEGVFFLLCYFAYMGYLLRVTFM